MSNKQFSDFFPKKPNKRYFVFAYGEFYPSGGMNDFIGSVDDLNHVIRMVNFKNNLDFAETNIKGWNVLDLVTGEVVLEGDFNDLCE